MLLFISVLNDLLFQINHNYDYSCQDTSALIVFIRRNMLQIIQHEINLMKLRIATPHSENKKAYICNYKTNLWK